MTGLFLFLLLSIVDQNYGKYDNKIVGGNITSVVKYPFVVNIVISYDSFYELTGGTIISKRHLLTCAHSLQGKILNITVSVGSTIVQQGTHYYTLNYKYHPLYNDTTYDYDIGLVITQTDITLNGVTSKLAVLVKEGVKLVPGNDIIVLGWGSRNGSSIQNSPFLREVSIPIVSHAVCEQLYADPSEGMYISPRLFCAGDLMNGGRDACGGDSGGPALTPDGVQVGIVSNGYDCARADAPGTYTDVSLLRSWVRSEAGV